jgi:hypothetical protein
MKTKFMRIFRMLHNPAKQLRYRESWNGGQRERDLSSVLLSVLSGIIDRRWATEGDQWLTPMPGRGPDASWSAGQAAVWGAMDEAAIQVRARPAARMTKGRYPTCTLFGARQPCLFMVSIP